MNKHKLSLMDRFWQSVKLPINATDEDCWEWAGSMTNDGYGCITSNGKTALAHRVAFMRYKGAVPSAMCICHTCDNPSCINPSHLFLGSRKDNMDDMRLKGRDVGSQRTHCFSGHEYNSINTRISIRKNGSQNRHCRICEAIAKKKRSI